MAPWSMHSSVDGVLHLQVMEEEAMAVVSSFVLHVLQQGHCGTAKAH